MQNGSVVTYRSYLEFIGEYLGVSRSNIKGKSKLVEDLGLDSLDSLDFVLDLEEELNLNGSLPDKLYHKGLTVRELWGYVKDLITPSQRSSYTSS